LTFATAFASPADDTPASGTKNATSPDPVETLPTRIVPPATARPKAPAAATDTAHALVSPTPVRRSTQQATQRPSAVRVPSRPIYDNLDTYSYFRAYSRSGLSPGQLDELHRLALDHAQQDAAMDFNQRDMQQRAVRLLSAHDQALRSGLELLRLGDYQRAVLPLTLATRLDQGDPAARIHLAQARLGLGHYDQAAALLRRALQLQPHLIYADLQLGDYLPDRDELAVHTRQLREWTQNHAASAEVMFLQGFFELQLGHFEAANHAFTRAAAGLPEKDIVLEYLDITRPDQSAGSESATRSRPRAAH
jgi:tetratricopeptide (TPR) repeat protein